MKDISFFPQTNLKKQKQKTKQNRILYYNQLSGTIPTQLGNLINLQKLLE